MSEIILGIGNFKQEVLEADRPVVVDFWSPRCVPCMRMSKVIRQLSEGSDNRFKVGKVNVDEEPELAIHYGIMSIPTIKIFVNGKTVSSSIGVIPVGELTEMVEKAL